MAKKDFTQLAKKALKAVPELKEAPEDVAARQKILGTKRMREARFIDITKIKPDPNQVRKIDKRSQSLKELAQSIKTYGIIQPITVHYQPDKDFYQIITGERRYLAGLKEGLKQLPCIIKEDINKNDVPFHQLVENLHRENLNPIEEAEGFSRLIKNFGLTQKEITKQLGKSESYISRTLKVNDLPEAIKQEIRNSPTLGISISKEHLLQIARLKNDKEKFEIWEQIKSNNLNVREIRKAVKKKPFKIGSKRTPTQILIDTASKFTSKISTIKMETIEEKEKPVLESALKLLKNKLEEILRKL